MDSSSRTSDEDVNGALNPKRAVFSSRAIHDMWLGPGRATW